MHDYISEKSSEVRADGYVGRILDHCNRLTIFPLRGMTRDDILPGLRVTAFERRVTVAFMVTEDTILIEGVFYGGQDFETALRSKSG